MPRSREPFDRNAGQRTKRFELSDLPGSGKMGRRAFNKRLLGLLAGGAAAIAAAKWGFRFLEKPDEKTGVKAIIALSCGDSRHIGRLKIGNRVLHPSEYMHVSNAGAYPCEDLKALIDHLVTEKKLKRNEILVIGTAHYDPPCGGAKVTKEFVHHVQELMHHQFGFNEHQLRDYLTSYGHTAEGVLSSVKEDTRQRAIHHARLIHDMGVQHLTGIFDMDENQFKAVSSSNQEIRKQFSMDGIDFEGDPELEAGQTPSHLLLSVPGANGRGNPEGENPHWSPGKSFFVSINPKAPSAKSQLSILYYAYLTAKEHEEKKKGEKVAPKNIVLSGTQGEIDQLKAFIDNDALAQHMQKNNIWKLVYKIRK